MITDEIDVSKELEVARKMLNSGKRSKGLFLLKKLGDRPFDRGDFLSAFDIYMEYAVGVSETRGIAGFEYTLLDIADRYKKSGYWGEAARLYLVTANYLFENRILGEAAWIYEEAASAFERSGDDMKKMVGACLARAAECYDKVGEGIKAERTLLKALIKGADIDPNTTEMKARTQLRRNEYRDPAATYYTYGTLFEESLNYLREILMQTEIGILSVNIKTILLHYTAEGFLASAICYNTIKEKDNAIKIIRKAKDIFENSALLLKALLDSGLVSPSATNRCAFDALMALIINSWLGDFEDGKSFFESFVSLLGEFSETSTIKRSPYFNIMKLFYNRAPIEKILLELNKVSLGKLDPLRELFIQMMQEKKIV